MLDHRLRPLKDSLLAPLAVRLAGRVSPNVVTALALAAGLAAAWAAWRGAAVLALCLWVANRLLDGLDGAIARVGDRASDLGGYLDLVSDFLVYAAVPFGIAFGLAPGAVPIELSGGTPLGEGTVDSVVAVGSSAQTALAALMAVFYVNTAAWLTLSAILEKRAAGDLVHGSTKAGAQERGAATAIAMPAGVIGGAETAVLYAMMLAWPKESIALMWLMAVLVAISALQRLVWATRILPGLGKGRSGAARGLSPPDIE